MRYGLWVPIPQRVGNTTKWGSRFGTAITAVVIHRMEGSLEGSDSYLRREFADYYPYPRLGASTHFGIGLWYGKPQIRQWVDTANAAYGWAATPTDVPTPLARSVHASQLYATGTWPFQRSRIDLNRGVIHIEVEGFASQAWDARTAALLRELLGAIARAHGRLWVEAHTDMSSKPCPGMATFKAAMPGLYGSRLGTSAPAPAPTPTPSHPSTTIPRADGVTTTMRFRARNRLATIKKGKPVRNGASINARTMTTTTKPMGIRIIGEMKPTGSYDPWYIYSYYLGNGDAFCYSPSIDVTLR